MQTEEQLQPTTGTAVIPTPEAQALALMTPQEARERTTWDMTTAQGVDLYMACLAGETTAVADLLGQQIEVVHIFMDVRSSIDRETGEHKAWPWTALVCHDGRIISSSSIVIARTMARVMSARPRGPYDPPMRFALQRVPIGGGQHCHNLVYIPTVQSTPATKGAKGGKA